MHSYPLTPALLKAGYYPSDALLREEGFAGMLERRWRDVEKRNAEVRRFNEDYVSAAMAMATVEPPLGERLVRRWMKSRGIA